VSPKFGKNLEKYLNSILATEPYFLTQVPLVAQGHEWVVKQFETKMSEDSN
jgi:hypothetical protein